MVLEKKGKALYIAIILILTIQARASQSFSGFEERKQFQSQIVATFSGSQVYIFEVDAEGNEKQIQKIQLETNIRKTLVIGIFLLIECDSQALYIFSGIKYGSKGFSFVQLIHLDREENLKHIKIQGKDLLLQYNSKFFIFEKKLVQENYSFVFNKQIKKDDLKNIREQIKLADDQKTSNQYPLERIMQTNYLSLFEDYIEVVGLTSDPLEIVGEADNILFRGDFGAQMIIYDGVNVIEHFETAENINSRAILLIPEENLVVIGQGNSTIVSYKNTENGLNQVQRLVQSQVSNEPIKITFMSPNQIFVDYQEEKKLQYNFDENGNLNYEAERGDASLDTLVCRKTLISVFKNPDSSGVEVVMAQGTMSFMEKKVSLSFIAQNPRLFHSQNDQTNNKFCERAILISSQVGVFMPLSIDLGSSTIETNKKVLDHITNPQSACMNNDGSLVAITGSTGMELWKNQGDTFDGYEYVGDVGIENIGSSSCQFVGERLYLGTAEGKLMAAGPDIVSALQQEGEGNNGDDAGSYGKKGDLEVNKEDLLEPAKRSIEGLAISGRRMLIIEKYGRVYPYTGSNGEYTLQNNLSPSIFLSCLDYDADEEMAIFGSYDKNFYPYQASGEQLASLPPVSTKSQILALDFAPPSKLLLGHMDGTLSLYTWASSSFSLEEDFQEEGCRVLAVKLCPDDSMISLKEKFGWFHLELRQNDGVVLHSPQLTEFFQSYMAVTDDCSKIFVSNTMEMNIKVYTQTNDQLDLTETIEQPIDNMHPLGKISLNPDGDLLVVAQHAAGTSSIFKFDECEEKFVFENSLTEGTDDSSVFITDSQIALGNLDGTVQLYTYSFEEKTCDSFGRKTQFSVTDVNEVSDATRGITAVTASGEYVIAASKYSGILVFSNPDSAFAWSQNLTTDIFVSDLVFQSSLNLLVAGSYSNSAQFYTTDGSTFSPPTPITTESQVTCVDLSSEGILLLGMANGTVTQYLWGGSAFGEPSSLNNSNSRVEGVAACPNDGKVVLLETEGVFSLKVLDADDNVVGNPEFTTKLEDELVEAYLAVTPDCSVIAVSGVTMSKVQVFIGNVFFESVSPASDPLEPLGPVSINEDGDLLLFSSITTQVSYAYRFSECEEAYVEEYSGTSGGYDQATAITSKYFVQGNEDGSIKISEYQWVYNPKCPSIAQSSAPRRKSQQNSSDLQKIAGTENMPAEKNGLPSGAIASIVLGAIIVTSIIVLFGTCGFISVIRSSAKKPFRNSENSETANEISRSA